MRAARFDTGFTLLEMMIVVSIMAVLGTMAVPSFTGMIRDNERAAAVNSFVHSLYLARSEAIKRGEVVSLCKSVDSKSCSNTAADWNAGWIVFVNKDRDDLPVRDADEDIIQIYSGWSNGHITSNRAAYSFRGYTQAVVNGTVVFCDARGSSQARAIIISHTGRPRIAQKDSNNKPLKCPLA
jgi:type IV fimbrial biogenesis protein FimT